MDILERLLSDTLAVVTNSTGDILLISIILTTFVLVIFMGIWAHNRRKFQNLSHQIPASVVKNYLDTIIQNSTSLKDSLFRGGGLEIGQGIPSVKPVQDLSSGGVDSSLLQEQLNQKLAEISSIKGQLSEKDQAIIDLEKKLQEAQALASSGDSGEQIQALTSEKDQLASELKAAQDALAAASEAGGDDSEIKGQLESVTKERDDLQDRLGEYAIIEEDLADLKRLQKENKELKDQLAGGGAAPAAEPEAEPVAEEEPKENVEEAVAAAIEESEAPAEETAEAAAEEPAKKEEGGEEKSAEELLSEFEKMLG
ncbi:MAG: hypothetical protein ACO20H_13095 [Bacteriovoracaceae bacterium]